MSPTASLPPRLRFALGKVSAALLTVLCAAWATTLGPIPGVIAWVTAEHVLVALLLAGAPAAGRPWPPDGEIDPQPQSGPWGGRRPRPVRTPFTRGVRP